ncbi:uncharacterized protein LOC122453934 [Cervus canadensis]|uniref:uncharacterized protein LOC122453934 n=1 Tax=Cervus canadensis TaxID=1574408 RepID=UPI001C9E8F5E|nr:uncharacterized protein LOC122453934 [Cervus canadensis]
MAGPAGTAEIGRRRRRSATRDSADANCPADAQPAGLSPESRRLAGTAHVTPAGRTLCGPRPQPSAGARGRKTSGSWCWRGPLAGGAATAPAPALAAGGSDLADLAPRQAAQEAALGRPHRSFREPSLSDSSRISALRHVFFLYLSLSAASTLRSLSSLPPPQSLTPSSQSARAPAPPAPTVTEPAADGCSPHSPHLCRERTLYPEVKDSASRWGSLPPSGDADALLMLLQRSLIRADGLLPIPLLPGVHLEDRLELCGRTGAPALVPALLRSSSRSSRCTPGKRGFGRRPSARTRDLQVGNEQPI